MDGNEELWRRSSAQYICRAIGSPRVLQEDVEADIALFRLEGCGRTYAWAKAWRKAFRSIRREWAFTTKNAAGLLVSPPDSSATLEYETRDMLRCLAPRQQQVILMRIAGHTLAEVGEEIGVCGARARQIEQQAINKLRRHFQ
jgi:DNA-directed RNA polymerase specialized sigma24 family protein